LPIWSGFGLNSCQLLGNSWYRSFCLWLWILSKTSCQGAGFFFACPAEFFCPVIKTRKYQSVFPGKFCPAIPRILPGPVQAVHLLFSSCFHTTRLGSGGQS